MNGIYQKNQIINSSNNENNKIGSSDRKLDDENDTQKKIHLALFQKYDKHKKEKIVKLKNEIKTDFNLDQIGKIELAKIHSQANRPLRKKNDFNSYSIFCPCCGLPREQYGVLEQFKICDNTENFVECGQGVTLYFSFFRFSIIIMLISFVILGIPCLYFSRKYSSELNSMYKKYYFFINNNNTNIGNYFLNDTDWSIKFSTANIKPYKIIYKNLTNKETNNIDKLLINFNLLSFICSITVFIFNIFYIIFIFNYNKDADIKLVSPSDYTVCILNMYGFMKRFMIQKKRFMKQKDEEPNKLNEDGTPYDFKKEFRKKLGVDNIPENINEDEEFYYFIKNKIFKRNGKIFNVKNINLCIKLNEFMELQEELLTIKKHIFKIENHPYQISKNKSLGLKGDNQKFFDSFLSGYDLYICNCYSKGKSLSKLKKRKNEIETKLKELLKNSKNVTEENFAGAAFITFNTIKEKELFLSEFPKNIVTRFFGFIKNMKYIFCFCCINKIKHSRIKLLRNITYMEAPEPEDIIFENLEFSSMYRTFWTFIIFLLSFIMIIFCFAIILFFNYLQDYVDEKDFKRILRYVISLITSIFSTALNNIFQYILDYLTKKEKQYSMTNYYLSYSLKLTLFTFFTSGVVPLICEFYRKTENHEILISNMFMMFLMNCFVTPFLWTFNINYIIKKLQIHYIETKKNPNLFHYRTQKELNELYELQDMNVASKYSYLITTLLMAFLYVAIFPFGLLICFLGFIFGYFLEKFNYCHIYKRPEMLNNKLCKFYVDYFVVALFVLAIGNYVFLNDAYENKNWCLVNIICFGILVIVPFQQFLKNNFLGYNESEINKKTYEEVYFTFYNDYERANPITKIEGIKIYLKKLLESNKISQENYDNYIENINKINVVEIYYENKKVSNLLNTQKQIANQQQSKYENLENNKNENIEINNNNIEVKNENDNDIKVCSEEIRKIYNDPLLLHLGFSIPNYFKNLIKLPQNNESNEKHNNTIKEEEEEKNDEEKIEEKKPIIEINKLSIDFNENDKIIQKENLNMEENKNSNINNKKESDKTNLTNMEESVKNNECKCLNIKNNLQNFIKRNKKITIKLNVNKVSTDVSRYNLIESKSFKDGESLNVFESNNMRKEIIKDNEKDDDNTKISKKEIKNDNHIIVNPIQILDDF